MLNSNNRISSFATATSKASSYDLGLREYMVKVYNFMSLSLGISGLLSFLIASSPLMISAIFGTPLQWVVMFAPFLFVLFFNSKINSISASTAKTYLLVFAALMGVSVSSIFMIYTAESITRVFFISSSTFAAMSIYGYTTKKDLTAIGSFLIMGLIAVLIASIVNIFLQSSAMNFALSVLGTFIFIGFTAYDTQRIKQNYYHVSGNSEAVNKMAVIGALSLYTDFINLFISMLRLFGERK